MKDTMSNVDIRVILPELRERIEGGFVKNIYQYGDVFVIKIYRSGGGTFNLLVEPGCRIHLTQFRRVSPRNPPRLVTVLRKYLRDKRVVRVYQHDLDRIVVLEIEDEQERNKLVAELFGTGNLLLLDEDNRIFVAQHYKRMRDRDIIPKATYQFPPPRGADIFETAVEDLTTILSDSKTSVVRTLASRLNLDALSCEEICALSQVPPSMSAAALDKDSIVKLGGGLRTFIDRVKKGVNSPRIVFDTKEEETENIAFIPFPFEMFKDLPFQAFDTFSHAIDEYFGITDSERDVKEHDTTTRERARLMRIIEKQREGITSLEQKASTARRAGELIYTHFQTVEEVLNTIRGARERGLEWSEIIARIEQGREQGNPAATIIRKISPSEAQIVVSLDGTEVRLDIRKNAQDNAATYYDLAKKSEKKIQGAMRQIEKTQEKLQKLAEVEGQIAESDTAEIPIRIRRKKWYEKFRWFISSEGYLVIGGRDAKTNEMIAKRYLEPNDIFLHAALHGAPYTVIKVPREQPGEATLREAAQFAVTYSRAWQDGFSSGDAYWVTPDQVSFAAPSGEYLPSGAVMIYGTKNYIKGVPVELAVGVIFEEEWAIPIAGPPSAIAAHTEYYVRVQQGNVKKGILVREIAQYLRTMVPEEKALLVKQIPQEDIMRLLPTGGGRLVKMSHR